MTEEQEVEEVQTKKPTMLFYVIAGVVVVVLLIYFIVRIQTPPEIKRNTIEYSYFTFEEVDGTWQTTIKQDSNLIEGVFRFNPKQVEDVYVTGNFSGFRKQPIYITFDPNSSTDQFKYLALATSELTLHLVRGLNYTVEAACTRNETAACMDRPIVNCGDENKSVILIAAQAPTQITLQGSCVALHGLDFELLKSVDRLLYQWYKIMR